MKLSEQTKSDINRGFEALLILDEIKNIISTPNMVIQEDAIKYKLICEVIREHEKMHQGL